MITIRSHRNHVVSCRRIVTFAFLTLSVSLSFFPLTFGGSKRKDSSKAAFEILEKIKKELAKSGKFSCTLKEVTERQLNKKRLKEQDIVLPCIIKYLETNTDNAFQWSALGTTLKGYGKPLSNLADTCFKQASKYTQFQTHIPEWSFLGPYVIGKTEFDGDPVEVYGGIRNVSRYRYDKIKYSTELLSSGDVKWKRFQQTSSQTFLKIIPEINWNDLVSSLGSLAITEWRGWLVGEFSINNKNGNLLVQCLGVPLFYIDDIPYPGEVYSRDQYWNLVDLELGVHTLYMMVRTKAVANVRCTFKNTKSTFEVMEPAFLPDVFNGHLFGTYLSIPVSNYNPSKSLKITKVTIKTNQDQMSSKLLDTDFSVKPGQMRPVLINITDGVMLNPDCESIPLQMKFLTSAGPASFSLNLRCRKLKKSFLFTFLDHDGSVQHAAAIYPLQNCLGASCPIVLSLHGTTVPPQNQADSYKHMVDDEFHFGVEGAWLLAPTRHGAHNWEGPGLLTALFAADVLASLTTNCGWLDQKATTKSIVYAGHSMGAHGAWNLASHYPDNALAVISQAGWIKKEEYGDSNEFFRHDIATSYTDPAIKFIMESCIVENDADKHVSNMKGLPVLSRIGEKDRTVHPYFMRRMNRLLLENGINVTYTELAGKEHWWWDTSYTNDGGVTNDKQVRDFIAEHIPSEDSDKCSVESGCEHQKNRYFKQNPLDSFTVRTYNPALGDTVYGLKILQQITPYRESSINCTLAEDAVLNTRNVYRFSVAESHHRPIVWSEKKMKGSIILNSPSLHQYLACKAEIIISLDSHDMFLTHGLQQTSSYIDGQNVFVEEDMNDVLMGKRHLCKNKGQWQTCDTDYDNNQQRSPKQLGPARRIAEEPLLIIVGTLGSTEITRTLRQFAVLIANLFFLTSDAYVPVIMDSEIEQDIIDQKNIILIGSPSENKYTKQFFQHIPVKIQEDSEIMLESCTFSHPQTGLMTLAPNGKDNLALILMGNTMDGLRDVVSLAKPTIPPMTRSPFSNLLPDFVITGPEFRRKGPGGFACVGFWGNKWEFRSDIASCVC